MALRLSGGQRRKRPAFSSQPVPCGGPGSSCRHHPGWHYLHARLARACLLHHLRYGGQHLRGCRRSYGPSRDYCVCHTPYWWETQKQAIEPGIRKSTPHVCDYSLTKVVFLAIVMQIVPFGYTMRCNLHGLYQK